MKAFKNPLTAIILSEFWLVLLPFNSVVFEKVAALSASDPILSRYVLVSCYFASLIIFTFLVGEHNAQKVMVRGLAATLILSVILYFSPNSITFIAVSALIGISSSYFTASLCYLYIFAIPKADRLKNTAILMLSLNLLSYVLELLSSLIGLTIPYAIACCLLVLNIWVARGLNRDSIISRNSLQQSSFPTKLIALFTIFIFSIYLNSGMLVSQGYDSFLRFEARHPYYNGVPAIIVALIIYFIARKIDPFVLAYLIISCLGLAFVTDLAFSSTTFGSFIAYTFSSTADALVDIFMWTQAGEISLKHGRTLKVLRMLIFALILGWFSGETLGSFIFRSSSGNHLLAGLIPLLILFTTFAIMPWLGKYINKEMNVTDIKESEEEKYARILNQALSLLPESASLTPRELDVIGHLLRGHSNVKILQALYISENTLKVHTRHIYQKFGVANRKELIGLVEGLKDIV